MSEAVPDIPLFGEQPGADVACMFAILIGSMIAAGGGLGGGGVFVPIYILILGYETKYAAALSQATIFGGSIVNLIMNLKKFHPIRQHRPLTDFTTLLIFEPMLLVGTIIGVLLNVVFPDILILICLLLVLSYATVRTTRKGIRLWQKETSDSNSDLKNSVSNINIVELANIPKHSKTNQPNFTKDLEHVKSFSHGVNVKKVFNKDDNDNDKDSNDEDKDTIANDKDNGGNNDDNTDTINKNKNKNENKPVDVTVNQSESESQHLIDLDDDNDKDKDKDTAKDPDTLDRITNVSDIQESNTNFAGIDKEDIEKLAIGCGISASKIDTDSKIETCRAFIERESKILKPMLIILIIWISVSLTSIFKKTTVELCSAGYWIFTFLPFPIMTGVSLFITKKEYDYFQIKLDSNLWVPAFGDIKLEGSFIRILQYPLIATVAGILGGLLGIGGGMIVSPLLIELGVIPTVAAATSAMAVLITSSSAMLQFLLLGFLDVDYMFFFMFIGILGTFLGQTAVNYAIRVYGRISVIIFAVATIMGLAILLMAINGIIELVEGISWAAASACN